MPAKKRTDFDREENYSQIIPLYLHRNMSQAQIGKKLGLSQGMISQDLKEIQRRWLENTTMDLDEAKAKELARIDSLERTYSLDRERYLAAWEASKTERSKTRKDTDGSTKDGKIITKKASVQTETRDGNPAFLDGMLKCNAGIDSCIDRRCKIIGAYAPTKSELTGKDGGPIQTEQSTKPDLSKLSLDELLQLRQMMSKASDGIAEPV